MKTKRQRSGPNAKDRFTVILARPEHPENIGLVARSLKNTGFEKLRLVHVNNIEEKSFVTAVHAHDILESVRFYPDVEMATADLDIVFAATAKKRKNFSSFSLADAVAQILCFPPATQVGLLFGNERTGLTSQELKHSNFRFTIPQAAKQPSYNLASAVLLTLFTIHTQDRAKEASAIQGTPLSRKKQEECICLILENLEERRFIHSTNKKHVTDLMHDLFGRLTMTEKDRKLLLALFSKGTR